MNTTEIRQRLHDFIDTAEDKKIEAIYTLLENTLDIESQLSESQKNELDVRMQNYINGSGKSYTWDDTVEMARKAVTKKNI